MMRRVLAFIVAWLLTCAATFADDTPRTMLRAHLEPAGPVVAGSTVKLVVDALTTTWFTAAPDWPLVEVRDAFVTLPEDDAQNVNDTIDGVRWFGVSRAYHIVPRASGRVDVPSFAITLHPGGADAPVTLNTPPFTFTATLPAGAENMATFFPAPNVTVTQRIEGDDRTLEVGDTITRIVTQRADASDAMMIPPVAFGEIDGLRRFVKPPATRAVTQNRDEFVAGERTDTVSYVVNRRGRFELPAITIEWWNTRLQRRETIELPAVRFHARAAHDKPLWAIPADALGGMARHTVIYLNARDIAMVCMALACVVFGVWAFPHARLHAARAMQRWRAARKRHAEGELAAWRALRIAARTGIMQRVTPALYRWMDVSARFGKPARLARVKQEEGAQLQRLARNVEAHYAHDAASELTPVRLQRPIQWRRWQRATRRERPALPPLNEK